MKQDIFYKGYKIKIRQDEDCESPNDWEDENLFLVYDHRQFHVGRKGFEPRNIYEYLEIKKQIIKYKNTPGPIEELEDDLKGYFDYESQYWIFPVDAYIHSGVHISLANTKDYPDRRWDVSTTGYILVERETWNNFDDAVEAAEGLIKEWNYCLSGEVYGFIIEKPNKTYTFDEKDFIKISQTRSIDREELINICDIEDEWEEIDSCWGYYGEPEESGLLDEARSVINYKTRNE